MRRDMGANGSTVVRHSKRMVVRMLAVTILSLVVVVTVVALLLLHAGATNANAAASPKYVKSGDGTQKNVSTTITWYGYNDNSGETEDQHGSADIAYPKSDGYPTIHNQAHEGTGAYTDPITFAAPNKDLKSSFPIGSIIYVPMVKKYFVMEDECGDDDPEGCQNGTNHADLWMGPAQALNGTKLDNCEGNATPDSAVNVTINPSTSLAVDTTVMYTSANKCTIKLYSSSQSATPVNSTPTATATPKPVATVAPTPIATSIPTSAPIITPTPIVPPTPTPVVINSTYVKSGDGTQKSVSTTITWYGYNDNSGETEDQHGSADIAYPKSDGYPTVHNQAHEGTGAYNDPITFAAPNKDLKSSFPIGSVIYVPMVKKYFVMEDECGDDDPEGCQNGANHADLWMGPASELNGDTLDDCEGNATPGSAVNVTINPSPSLAVDTTVMYTSANKCTIKLYN